jgi:hypothetical protein
MANIRLGSKGAVATPALTDKHTITQAGSDYSETNTQVLGLLDGYAGDIDTSGTIKSDTIDEHTANAGVGIKTKDGSVLRWKIIEIGNWNMDSTGSVTVAHGLTQTKIRTLNAEIRGDVGSAYETELHSIDSYINTLVCGFKSVVGAYIVLTRTSSGFFDSNFFDATSYNRGWITIGYVD